MDHAYAHAQLVIKNYCERKFVLGRFDHSSIHAIVDAAAEMLSLKQLFKASGRRLGGGSAIFQRRLFHSKPHPIRGWPNTTTSLSLKTSEFQNGWKVFRSIPLTSFFRDYGGMLYHGGVKYTSI